MYQTLLYKVYCMTLILCRRQRICALGNIIKYYNSHCFIINNNAYLYVNEKKNKLMTRKYKLLSKMT